jgi:hypothetical protein
MSLLLVRGEFGNNGHSNTILQPAAAHRLLVNATDGSVLHATLFKNIKLFKKVLVYMAIIRRYNACNAETTVLIWSYILRDFMSVLVYPLVMGCCLCVACVLVVSHRLERQSHMHQPEL